MSKSDMISKRLIINISMFLLTALIVSSIVCLAKHEFSYSSFGYVFIVALIASVLLTIISITYNYVIFRIAKCKFKFWSFYNALLPFLLLVLIAGVVGFLYIKEKIILEIISKLSGYIVGIYMAYIVHKNYDVEIKKCFIYFGISFVINSLSFL